MRIRVLALVVALAAGCADATRSEWDEAWRDGSGEEVPERVLSTSLGPEHCGWQSAVFLFLRRGAPRTYVRDPEGLFEGQTPVPFDDDAELPADASYSGFHLGRTQLWISRKQAPRAVYVVRSRRVERWPRYEGACA
ncbi:MAG TPA: hypothetical protein VG079_03290 [Gaiellaceae bacterium]|nr:hypothetical protein [Gaiellaceae bacterium]